LNDRKGLALFWDDGVKVCVFWCAGGDAAFVFSAAFDDVVSIGCACVGHGSGVEAVGCQEEREFIAFVGARGGQFIVAIAESLHCRESALMGSGACGFELSVYIDECIGVERSTYFIDEAIAVVVLVVAALFDELLWHESLIAEEGAIGASRGTSPADALCACGACFVASRIVFVDLAVAVVVFVVARFGLGSASFGATNELFGCGVANHGSGS
jgi:hypothetical protein